MIKKTIGFLTLSLIFAITSCKQESVAEKITDADMKTVEAEKALVGDLPKVKLDKEIHDFGTIAEGDVVETEFIVTNTGASDLLAETFEKQTLKNEF